MDGCVSFSWMANLSGNASKVRVPQLVAPDDVGDRAGHEEVLLLEAQRLAFLALVVRVEDLRDVLGVDLLLDGAPEVSFVEELQVEVARGARRPQAQRVRRVGAVAHDERVVGQADDGARVDPVGAQAPVAIVLEHHPPAEAHGLRVFVARQLPGVAQLQPVVVLLDLAAAFDLLLEHAEVVADAVADRGQLQRRQRVHEASRQAPEAAIAEARIALALQHLSQLQTVVGRQLDGSLVEVHVHQAQAQAAPGEKLRREVADPLDVAFDVRALRRQPAVDQAVADRVRERVIEVQRRSVAQLLGAGVDDVIQHGSAKVGGLQACTPAAGGPGARLRVLVTPRVDSDAHGAIRPRGGERGCFGSVWI